MPPVEVYSVNFANGNLTPSLDSNGWGGMQRGSLVGAGDSVGSFADSQGLTLVLNRAAHPNTSLVTNSVYVIPPYVIPPVGTLLFPTGTLLLSTRLLLRASFDSPFGEAYPPPQKVEPWAVVLKIKMLAVAND